MYRRQHKAAIGILLIVVMILVAGLDVQAYGTLLSTSTFTSSTNTTSVTTPNTVPTVSATTETVTTTQQQVTLDKTFHEALNDGKRSSKVIKIDEFSGEIKSIKELEKYPKLEKLMIAGDGTYQHNEENEAILNSLKNLKILEIYCDVKGKSMSLTLPKLEKFIIGDSQYSEIKSSLEKIDISKCGKLSVICCYGAKNLNKIILPKKGKVRTLICNKTGVSSLVNLKKQKGLKGLDCAYTNITKLNLSKSSNLVELNCQYTKINSLNLKRNSKLRRVILSPSVTKKISYPSNLYKYFYLDLQDKKPQTLKLKNYMPQGYRYYESTDVAGKRVAQANQKNMKYKATSHTLKINGKWIPEKDQDMSFKKGNKYFNFGTGGRAFGVDSTEIYMEY